MTDNFKKLLLNECDKLGIILDEEKMKRLFLYYEMVTEKNKVMNLTAVTDESDFVIKHIVDSLAIVKAGDKVLSFMNKPGVRVIDVGTGAGIPGIILKIAYPEINIVLFDSLKKRLKFLDEVIERLGLENAATLHGRAEDIGKSKEYRESFDIVLSRAVANMSTLSEYCLPLTRQGGFFIPYKSGEIEEELNKSTNAIKKLGGKVTSLEKYLLPDTDISRSLVIVEKTGRTPAFYPRRAGIPSKEPL